MVPAIAVAIAAPAFRVPAARAAPAPAGADAPAPAPAAPADTVMAAPTATAAAPAADSLRAVPVHIERSLTAREALLLPGERVRTLPDRFILPGSESVRSVDSLLARGLDYDLDYDRGVLRLRADHEADSVRIVYRRVPISLASKLALREPAPAPADGTPATAAAARAATPPADDSFSGSKLSLFGSKTFGIEVGSQRDLAVRQALDLTVRGSVARDVEVLALLSDRDTPLQPEGNTTELQELDKVLVEVKGRGVGASLGDVNVRFAGAEFARVERKLEGASARGARGGWSMEAAGAVSRGQFRSTEFRGTEGKQGPYVLAGDAGERVIVLAGTERVWLDGQALTRGEKADYTIDYSLGEVTFTSLRAISSASRITIDYEYSSEAYRRRFYAVAGGGSAAGGALTVRTTYLSESDDRGAPRQVALSEEDREILRSAGDDIDGEGAAVYVGSGGDYVFVDGAAASGAGAHFEYAGAGLGDYRVRFRRVAAGAGAYADSVSEGRTIYRYLGAGLGTHEPGAELPLPRSNDVSDVVMEYRAGAALAGAAQGGAATGAPVPAAAAGAGAFGWAAGAGSFGAAPSGAALLVRGEGALSHEDANTFSGVDDGDNTGRAYHLTAEASAPPLEVAGRSVGTFRVRGSARQVDSRFRSLGRLDEGFSHETWNASAGAFGADRRYEAGVDYFPVASARLYAEGGLLDAPGGFESKRRAFGMETIGALRVSARSERAGSETRGTPGERLADRIEAAARLGAFSPSVRARRERAIAAGDTSGAGGGFEEVGGSLRVALAAPFEVEAGLEGRRDEQRTGGDWSTSGRSLAQRYGFRMTRWHSVTANALYTHRRYESRTGAPSSSSDLGQLTLLHDAGAGGLTHEANVEITTTDLARRSRDVVFVGDGLGHYDELGRFVGSGGDYEIRLGETTGSDLTSRVDATFRSEIRPDRFLATGGEAAWLRALRSGTQIRLSESSDRSAGRVLAGLGRFDESTVTGSFLWRQEIELFPSGRALSLLARHESEERRDRQYTNIASERSRREETLRARSAMLATVSAELEQRWRTEDERASVLATSGSVSDRSRLQSRRTSATVTYTPVPAVRAQVAGGFGHESLEGTPGRNIVWDAGPSLAYTFGARGRIEGRARWTIVDGGLDVRRFLPISTTEREGMEWNVLLDYRLSTRLNALVSADGRRPEIGRPVTTGRLEMRASF